MIARTDMRARSMRTQTTKDGRLLKLRPIAPTDVRQLLDFVRGLSFGTKYFRFGRGDIRFSEKEAVLLCNPDPQVCWRFVVVTEEIGVETQVAAASCHIQPDQTSGELTILVSDAWQGAGLADWLMDKVKGVARGRGLQQLIVHVLATNSRMLQFARKHGFSATEESAHSPIKRLGLSLGETESVVARSQISQNRNKSSDCEDGS